MQNPLEENINLVVGGELQKVEKIEKVRFLGLPLNKKNPQILL